LPPTACNLSAGNRAWLSTLGFMLPTTPLHLLLLQRFDHPVVMTSGNVCGSRRLSVIRRHMSSLLGSQATC